MSFTSAIIPPVIAIGIAAPATFMVLDRSLPTTVTGVSVETLHVLPGGDLTLAFTIDRKRTCSVTTTGLLIDSSGAETDFAPRLFQATGPVGVWNRDYVQKLPDGVVAGPARFILYASYVCNPVHAFWPITHVNADVRFIIDDPKAGETIQKEPSNG